jgi:hypothetical protein
MMLHDTDEEHEANVSRKPVIGSEELDAVVGDPENVSPGVIRLTSSAQELSIDEHLRTVFENAARESEMKKLKDEIKLPSKPMLFPYSNITCLSKNRLETIRD